MNSGSVFPTEQKDISEEMSDIEAIKAARGGLNPIEREYYEEEYGINFNGG